MATTDVQKQEDPEQTLALLNAIIESTADSLLVVGIDGKIVMFNQNFIKLWRIPESILNTRDDRLALEYVIGQLKQPEKFLAKVQELYSNPMAESFDTLEFKDDRIVDRYSKPQLLNGRAVGRVWSFRDVTELKLIEGNLKSSRDYYHAIINSVNDYIIVLDPNCLIKYVNHALPGINKFKLSGANALDWVAPDFKRIVFEMVAEIAKFGKSETLELQAFGPQGHLTWFQVKFSMLRSPTNVEILLVATDYTDQKNVEQKLNEARLSAESASNAKSAFLANMSHEIRTPLGAVMGFAELVTSSDVTDAERQYYGAAIKRNGLLLSNIISDILDLSKIEVGKLNVDCQKVLLEDVLADLETILTFKAAEKGIRFSYIFEGPIPKFVHTDPMRLRQILLNIAGNSIKFTDHGSVTIAVKMVQDRLAFVVRDTGIGITPGQANSLFQPFSQADNSIVSKYGGTGLGLIISKRLAVLLGGDVALTESSAEKGSTFTVTINPGLPQSAELLAPAAIWKKFKQAPSQAISHIDLDHTKILVVDDSEDNQLLISKVLKLAGADIETAENGKKALDMVHQNKYDLLLVDLQMPVLDGYDTTSQLRREGYTTPIIALTAHALKEIRERCLQSGFDDFITKPIDRNLLINKIAEYIHKPSLH